MIGYAQPIHATINKKVFVLLEFYIVTVNILKRGILTVLTNIAGLKAFHLHQKRPQNALYTTRVILYLTVLLSWITNFLTILFQLRKFKFS